MEKTTNTAAAAKNITRMLTALKKRDARTAMHYPWTDNAGRQCVCDGYRAYRLTEALPLEERPDDAGEPVNLDVLFAGIDLSAYTALPLPTAAELKAHIAADRAASGKKSVPLWDFGSGHPAVNACYLQDLMTVFPDAAEVFCKPGAAGILSPIYARGERGEGILLPVRTGEKHAAAKAAAEAEEPRQCKPERRAELEKAAAAEAAEAAEQARQQAEAAASVRAAAASGWVFDANTVTISGVIYPAEYSVTPGRDVYAFTRPADGQPAARYHIPTDSPMYAAARAAAAGCPAKPAANAAETVEAPAAAEASAEAPKPATAEKPWIGSNITGNGWRILFDAEAERTRVCFDADPTEAQRAAVQEAGFYWSKLTKSFNKKLTCKAYRAAKALAIALAALHAA